MSELERQLVALGAELELPATPAIAAAAARRLRAAPEPRRRSLRPLLVALAVLLVAIGVAFAVPPARTAILRFFHLRGLTVERVETLPPAQERPLAAGLGRPVHPSETSRLAGFRMRLPRGKHPSRVYAGDGYAAAIFRFHGSPVLLFEFRGPEFGVIKKALTPQTRIEPITVNGEQGLWITGAPHVVSYVDRSGRVRGKTTRFAGNVLAWQSGALTLRLERELTKRQALKLARQISPG
jgi:hypothetical protein